MTKITVPVAVHKLKTEELISELRCLFHSARVKVGSKKWKRDDLHSREGRAVNKKILR